MGQVTSFGAQQKENSPLKTVKKCPEFPKDENAQPTTSPKKQSPTKRAKHSAQKPKNQNNENSLSPIKLRQLESGPGE
jgi:ribosome-binding protein aMBF1 (putative translation factor)